MPGSATTPDPRSPCAGALRDVAFHVLERVGIRDKNPIVAQWLACTCPCRRFDDSLAAAFARLEVALPPPAPNIDSIPARDFRMKLLFDKGQKMIRAAVVRMCQKCL